MSRVLVIGCGGVASVAIHKICQVSEVFSDLCIASRTVSKCDKLADELKDKTSTNITTAKVDADNTDEVIALINEFKPDVVLNVALPYQDLTIMDACLACKVPYVDTANYECEDTDNPEWRKVYVPDTRGLLEMCGTPSYACFCMRPHLHHRKDFHAGTQVFRPP